MAAFDFGLKSVQDRVRAEPFMSFYRDQYGKQAPTGPRLRGGVTGNVQRSLDAGDVEKRALAASLATLDRRQPFGAGQSPDYTDVLMKRLQSAELVRLGIGKTRQSLFTLSPSAVSLTGGYGT